MLQVWRVYFVFFFLKEKTLFYFLFFKTKLTCSYQTRTYWLVNEQKLFCDSSKKSKAVQYSCFGAFETFIEHSTQSTCYSYNYVPFGNVKLALPMLLFSSYPHNAHFFSLKHFGLLAVHLCSSWRWPPKSVFQLKRVNLQKIWHNPFALFGFCVKVRFISRSRSCFQNIRLVIFLCFLLFVNGKHGRKQEMYG